MIDVRLRPSLELPRSPLGCVHHGRQTLRVGDTDISYRTQALHFVFQRRCTALQVVQEHAQLRIRLRLRRVHLGDAHRELLVDLGMQLGHGRIHGPWWRGHRHLRCLRLARIGMIRFGRKRRHGWHGLSRQRRWGRWGRGALGHDGRLEAESGLAFTHKFEQGTCFRLAHPRMYVRHLYTPFWRGVFAAA